MRGNSSCNIGFKAQPYLINKLSTHNIKTAHSPTLWAVSTKNRASFFILIIYNYNFENLS